MATLKTAVCLVRMTDKAVIEFEAGREFVVIKKTESIAILEHESKAYCCSVEQFPSLFEWDVIKKEGSYEN
jgi:RecB family endonuclease NucS